MKSKVLLLIMAITLAFSVFVASPAHSVSAQTVKTTHVIKASAAFDVGYTWWDADHYVNSYLSWCGYRGVYLTPVTQVVINYQAYSGWFKYYQGGGGIIQNFSPGSVYSYPLRSPYTLITQIQINC